MNCALLDGPSGIDMYHFSTRDLHGSPVDTRLSSDLKKVKVGFAHPVRQDWLRRVIYPVNKWDPKVDVSGARIVLVDTGVSVVKGGHKDRPLVPALVSRLKSICRLATIPVPRIGFGCLVCAKGDEHGAMKTCAICTLTFHEACDSTCLFETEIQEQTLLMDSFRPEMMCSSCKRAFGV